MSGFNYMFDKKPTPEMDALLVKAGDFNQAVATAALGAVVKAVTLPLQQGVLKGDIISGIYQSTFFKPGQAIEYPIDFITSSNENDWMAYTLPNQGRIPEKSVQGDYVMISTFDTGHSIDCNLKYLRDGRWDIMGRMLQALEAGHVRKRNNDGWHTIIAAAKGRNLMAYDDTATAGLFTKRVAELVRQLMRRNAGGNSTSLNRGKLTDAWVSPEALGDVRTWDLSQVDDFTRRTIFIAEGEQSLTKIFGISFHDMDELGEGQEYQNYYEDVLGGSMSGSKLEIGIGLDLENRDSFVRPIRQEMEVFEDLSFHRQRRASLYSWEENGFCALNSRRAILFGI